MKTKKSIKLRKIFIAAAAITTLSAAFTSCKKDSNILPAESIEKSTMTGEFKEDHAAKFFDRDGNEFKQVRIHRYAWMTSNLKTNTANSEITEKGEHYYTYADAMSGVCPEGWFIPTTDAWEDLKEEMGHHCNGGEPEGISMAMRCNAWKDGTNTSALNFKPFERSNFAGFWLTDGAVYIYEDRYEVVNINNITDNIKLAVRCVRNN